MSYRTRLFLLVVLAVVFSNLLLFSLLYVQTHKALFREIQSNATSIVASGAAMIDGELLAGIRSREDEGTPRYRTIEETLRKIRDANRRSDINVSYLYTMMASPDNSNTLVFGVDSEASSENKSHVCDVYKGTFGAEFKIQDRNFVDESPSRDQWGEWITACAPVKKRDGQVVSILCADLGYSDVQRKTTQKLILSGVVSLATTMVVALLFAMLLARHVSEPIHDLHTTLGEVGKGNFDVHMDSTARDEFGDVARTVNSMVAGLKQRDMLKGVFSRYVSGHILDSVIERGYQPNIEGERRKITVLFSDIRNFTLLSEQLSPEKVVALLNDYFEAMVEIIFKYQGTLDKFIGDGMMVIFGAPEDDPYQEEHAIRAALDMSRELKRLCDKWKFGREVSISIGIGINTGVAIVGNIGSHRHMEYTAIGDTVNLASRIESMTKGAGHSILVSDYTYVSVRSQFVFERIDNLTVKGKRDSIVVHAVIDEAREGIA